MSQSAAVLYRLSVLALLLAAVAYLAALEREAVALIVLARDLRHPAPVHRPSTTDTERPSA